MDLSSELESLRPIKVSLKDTLRKITAHFHTALGGSEGEAPVNPVIQAFNNWKIVSEQLRDILGKEIHTQWFEPIIPLVVSDNILILRTPSRYSTLWINNHYQELVDLLLSFQDKKLSSFFICPMDCDSVKRDNDSHSENH